MLRPIRQIFAALIVLGAVLGAVLPAAAAPKHRGVEPNPPDDAARLQLFYDNIDRSPANQGRVSPANPGITGDRCLPSGPPCRTHPDEW
jgi:hypothetical protein